MKASSLPYLIKEGAYSVVKRAFMSFASVFAIIACLLIMGTFTLLGVNIQSILRTLEDENQVVAYVDDTYTEEQARSLQQQLLQVRNVSAADFVTNSQAFAAFKETYADSEILEDIDASVLRHRYLIHMVDVADIGGTMQALREVPGVAYVGGHLEIARGFTLLRNVVGLVTLLLTAVLLVISLLIMVNTIRLTTFDRREEIGIMKMVGATSGFIRMPFVVVGLYLGIMGALAAFLCQWGLYQFIARRIVGMGLNFIQVLPFGRLAVPVLLAFLATGVLVGVAGSLTAIRQYLRV